MSARRPLARAFDEVRFGESRTLNVRDSLPTAAEASRRVETWLRQKQVERAGDVLVITGRGNQSEGGVSVVRLEIDKLLARLKRANVVTMAREHTPGSFVVTLAPMRALFEAPARAGDSTAKQERPPDPRTLAGLSPETRARLRTLATISLDALGIQRPVPSFIQDEMHRLFAKLTPLAPTNEALRQAIDRAIEEFEEGAR